MSPRVEHSVEGIRASIGSWRARHPCGRLAFVPTMGALHDGHLELVRHGSALADATVVSIFVNPTQFAPGEDFEAYPRTLEDDLSLLARVGGVPWVFCPSASEIYPPLATTTVAVPALAGALCGASRPHFFGGVATVVCKLLNIVGADFAVFGEKDFQQLQVIRRMVRDLHMTTSIVGVPTVRESDGLAMSSRNRYLNDAQRRAATSIYVGLKRLERRVSEGQVSCAALLDGLRGEITASGGVVDYVALVDPDTLLPLDEVHGDARALVAAHFGDARLIDNLVVRQVS